MTAIKLTDEQTAESDIWSILYSISFAIRDDACIEYALSKMAATSIWKEENIDKVAVVMSKGFFNSDEVKSILVRRMELQAEKVVSQAT